MEVNETVAERTFMVTDFSERVDDPLFETNFIFERRLVQSIRIRPKTVLLVQISTSSYREMQMG